MEENILKYFFHQLNNTTETIKPINVENVSFQVEGQMNNYANSLVTKDEAYFIRYGGIDEEGGYNAIQVFNNESLENQEALYIFNNLKIAGHTFSFIDLHQDEDGRFYGIGRYRENNTPEYYLIILNNFIQDGTCKINKYYTNSAMGINDYLTKVIKEKNTGNYYMLSQTKLYQFSINILEGNFLNTYNIDNTHTPTVQDLSIIGNKVIIMQGRYNSELTNVTCEKLVIDTTKEIQNNYSFTTVYTDNSQIFNNFLTIENNVFKIPYHTMASGGNYFNYITVDLNGNTKIINYTGRVFGTFFAQFTDKYISIYELYNQRQTLLYNNGIEIIEIFSVESDFSSFLNLKIIKQFNLYYIIGFSTINKIMYSKNIYSPGYTSEPYTNTNFLIPQYLNLYSNSSDNTSVIFSRDAINKFLAGNQLTSVFNIPNYLLNNYTIQKETLYGQTNLAIQNDIKEITKNRFESLYLSYMNSLTIKDNTNGNNLINIEGSNRLADSIWNTLDYQQSPCLKARITYNDETQEIINLSAPTITDSTATYTYQVEGNINKIEYLSQDEQTVYATYRCNLTGTNTITQTIEVEEG